MIDPSLSGTKLQVLTPGLTAVDGTLNLYNFWVEVSGIGIVELLGWKSPAVGFIQTLNILRVFVPFA